MIHPLVTIILKTGFYAFRSLLVNEKGKTKLKKLWADWVLRYLEYEIEISGKPPQKGRIILVGNHISYIDIPLIFSAFPNAIFVAKDDLRKWPLLGAMISLAGTIFVSRNAGSDRTSARTQIINRLQSKFDLGVVVFPSGTTQLREAKNWKKGIFEIAAEAKLTVQLFKIQYAPPRESAYIDDDNFVAHIRALKKVKQKKAKLSWIGNVDVIGDPSDFSSRAREMVELYV